MSTSAVQSPLNPYLLESPRKIGAQLSRKAFTNDVLSKICYVATAAIIGVTLAVSFGLIIPTGGLSFLLFALVLSSAFLIFPAAGKFQQKAIEYKNLSTKELFIAKELDFVENQVDVEEFFKQHGLSLEHLPMEELKKLNPEKPLQALFPLIARFRYEKNSYDYLRKKLDEAEKCENKEIAPYLLHQRRVQYEREGIDAGLNAAWLLQVISHPTWQGRSYQEVLEREWIHLVSFNAKDARGQNHLLGEPTRALPPPESLRKQLFV